MVDLNRMGLSNTGGVAGQYAVSALASLNKGIDFRSTSGFVTDPANTTYALTMGTDGTYPISRGGLTFGYEATGASAPGAADRDSGNDPRLAGIHFIGNNLNQSIPFRIDLPAPGTYSIRVALGDASFSQGYTYFELFDDETSKLIIDKNVSIAANSFWDATGVARTAANWPSANVAAAITFSSSILRFKLGPPTSQVDSTVIAHIFID